MRLRHVNIHGQFCQAEYLVYLLAVTDIKTETPIDKNERVAYGAIFKPYQGRPLSDLEIELMLFAMPNKQRKKDFPQSPGRFHHCRRVIDLIWNNKKSPEVFDWTPWSIRIMENFCKRKVLALAGCASSGKSRCGALWAVLCFLSDPTRTKVIVTSTSLTDARNRIWGDIEKLFNAMVVVLGEKNVPGVLVSSTGIIKRLLPNGQKDATRGIVLVAGEKGKSDTQTKVLGLKAERVIVVADELCHLEDALMNTVWSNLSSNPFLQVIAMSNPKSYYDPFGRMAEPKNGWASIDETMDEWETVNGWCLRFDGEKSPNIMAGKTIWKYLLTQEELDKKKQQLLPTSPEYYRQVRGYFCPTGSVDSIFSETQIVRCNGDKKAIWLEPPIKVAGFDPAFTHGGDRSILYFGQFGITTDHLKTLEWTEYVHIEEDNRDKSAERNFQIARKLRAECEKRGVQCKHLAIDGTGAGKPFCDIVRNVWNGEFLELNFAGGATDLPASGTDPRPSKEAYVNHVSEIWFVGREYLSSNQIRGIGPDLAKELISRTYETKAGGKVQVEPKTLMKGRVGFSPDISDAALTALAVCRHRLGFGSKFKSGISPRKDNHRSFWSEPEQTKSPFKRFAKKVASLRRF